MFWPFECSCTLIHISILQRFRAAGVDGVNGASAKGVAPRALVSSTATARATLASAETVLARVLTFSTATPVWTSFPVSSQAHGHSDSILLVVVGRLGCVPRMRHRRAVSRPDVPGTVWRVVLGT